MTKFRDFINFRDLGQYKTKDGRDIKKGLIFRSAGLEFYNDEELEELKKLKLKTIFDLRSDKEIEEYPDPEIEGATYISCSGVISKTGEEVDFSPKGMYKTGEEGQAQIERIIRHYQDIPVGNRSFRLIFDELLEENVPLLFHCATGKDRTGVAAILILLALGVDEETVRYDYLISNENRKHILHKELKDIDKEEDPELYELTLIRRGVSERILDIVMETIKEKYSSYDEFFAKEYDLSKEDLERLRKIYLV